MEIEKNLVPQIHSHYSTHSTQNCGRCTHNWYVRSDRYVSAWKITQIVLCFAVSHGLEDKAEDHQWICISLKGNFPLTRYSALWKIEMEEYSVPWVVPKLTFHQIHIIAKTAVRWFLSNTTQEQIKIAICQGRVGLQLITKQWKCFWPLLNKPSLHKLYTKKNWEQILVIVIDISPRDVGAQSQKKKNCPPKRHRKGALLLKYHSLTGAACCVFGLLQQRVYSSCNHQNQSTIGPYCSLPL